MNYTEWVEAVPQEITDDSLWKMKAYRLALFVADIGWYLDAFLEAVPLPDE